MNSVEIWCPPHSNAKDDSGKLIFSASDDGQIRVWDLARREAVRVLDGHMAQVQSIRVITVDESEFEEREEPAELAPLPYSGSARPFLVSGSLDNCLKVWDLDRGVCARTMFGHIQGVWNVDADRLRVVR